ncbi:MAG: hypothetical protein R2855_04590 [Thermomicrobiales bacterium]
MRKLIAEVLVPLSAHQSHCPGADTLKSGGEIPAPNLPNFACTDTSYADAVEERNHAGVSPDYPYVSHA